MNYSFETLLFVLVTSVIALAYLRWKANYKPRTRHPILRTGQFDDITETKQLLATLFLQVVELRERAAKWPEIMTTLNPANQPNIRTVLLEMRWASLATPDAALAILEDVCLAAKESGGNMNSLDLLEVARTDVEKKLKPKTQ